MISDIEGGSRASQENKGMEGRSCQSVVPSCCQLTIKCHSVDPKTKKRKLSEPPTARPSSAQATKKVAVGTTSSTKPTVVVKKEVTAASLSTSSVSKVASSSSSTSKDAKADASFFSQPKKAKLPSFKKAPVPPPAQVKKEKEEPTIPSGYDAFQETLKTISLKRDIRDSPASMSTPPPASSTTASSMDAGNQSLTKNGKKRKSVTWAPEGLLESVKLIERAIYDDDVDVSSFSFSAGFVLYIDFDISFACVISSYSGYAYQLARFGQRRGCGATRASIRRSSRLDRAYP